ncbi:ketohexokinase-like isoform X2 [Macadamia integrifolia]|uniref:ketohexokinase-like isoform X2 n=1 Tax=Macadamia integrifolia TaxID=60698 RepID=UPI001C4E54F1|nr:ketohexokinase-like isoform X2 [Macadamia integrifolia]
MVTMMMLSLPSTFPNTTHTTSPIPFLHLSSSSSSCAASLCSFSHSFIHRSIVDCRRRKSKCWNMSSLPPSFRASAEAASSSVPPFPEKHIVVGCGCITVDFLAAVSAYPKPDDKIRSTSLKVQGGGNAGNALTCAARLGLNSRLISKVADDSQGRAILEELEADGVDTSYFVVSKEGNSPFTYVIVDSQRKTRTCIHSPGNPPMVPGDLSQAILSSALDGARLAYFDGRLHETALIVAQEANCRKIPILIDAERPREGLDSLLNVADYIVCSEKFPQAWTEAPSIPSALVSMLVRLPKIKFVIVTLGEDGCIMLDRHVEEIPELEEMDVDSAVGLLRQKIDGDNAIPTCIPSKSVMRLKADGIGVVNGKLFMGTAEKIPASELVDTTGAGDAFIGATLYAICADMPLEKMLPFAAQVAAAGCRALGARSGLPWHTDPRLAPFLS